jgi:hypothetical protein
MNTDRPDLPTFDGRDVREHATAADEAIRAINHITGWPNAGMTYPQDADDVIAGLMTMASRLPRALGQIASRIRSWYVAGEFGIDAGSEYADDPPVAFHHAFFGLTDDVAPAAVALYEALEAVHAVLAHAHHIGPDSYVEIVDDRDDDANGMDA